MKVSETADYNSWRESEKLLNGNHNGFFFILTVSVHIPFPQKMTELNVYGLKEWMDERMNGMYPCKWMSWMSMVWQDELSLILPSLQ